MTWKEAKKFAQNDVKITHIYFTDEEYLTMKGNKIIFEDGVEIYECEWLNGKDYLLDGWSEFKNTI